MRELSELVVLIKGGGEVASGIAHRLHRSHFRVCLTEVAEPLAVSRGTAFSEAVFDGVKEIMGIRAELVEAQKTAVYRAWQRGNIALVIDPQAQIKDEIKPDVLIDAIMAKRNTGTGISDAPLVIGVGPGFYASRDVHIVIESNHSPNLGRVILEGEAEPDSRIPVPIGGMAEERVIWSPQAGVFTSSKEIGDSVTAGEIIGHVGDRPLSAPMGGMLRGLLKSRVKVVKGSKLIEVDPIHNKVICNLITSKMTAIGDGVLKAITDRVNPNG